ncbi:hypothetical protein [Neptunomonas antarctica]|uniref:Uncharacterized protein n=1 Tax=Neptunomonas antarctica TaxID=619304 RepID=A0A1N7IYT6_9GAMM|nr:hypothetical protein [Neptunomonas antarctica]SIS42268.1 hypothetical protein SAMN05421760_101353 [Neptunomonas antarctica]
MLGGDVSTAGTILTLDGQGLDDQLWFYTIADILAFGSDFTVDVVNVNTNASVYWNSYNGYITSGKVRTWLVRFSRIIISWSVQTPT